MFAQAAKRLKILVAAAAVCSLAACASGARSGAMTAPLDTAHIIDQTSPIYMGLSVNPIQGGEETNALLQSKVSNEAFKAALEQSLQLNTMLASTRAKYTISVTIVDLKQPLMGFGMTVTALVHYVVSPIGGGAPVFDQMITSPYTAKFSDAFVGAERLRLANEGAVRTNIADFIRALSGTNMGAAKTS